MSAAAPQVKSRLWPLVNAVRVAGDIAVILLVYWSIGSFVRRRYRRCRATGETYWLDAPPQRGASNVKAPS